MLDNAGIVGPHGRLTLSPRTVPTILPHARIMDFAYVSVIAPHRGLILSPRRARTILWHPTLAPHNMFFLVAYACIMSPPRGMILSLPFYRTPPWHPRINDSKSQDGPYHFIAHHLGTPELQNLREFTRTMAAHRG